MFVANTFIPLSFSTVSACLLSRLCRSFWSLSFLSSKCLEFSLLSFKMFSMSFLILPKFSSHTSLMSSLMSVMSDSSFSSLPSMSFLCSSTPFIHSSILMLIILVLLLVSWSRAFFMFKVTDSWSFLSDTSCASRSSWLAFSLMPSFRASISFFILTLSSSCLSTMILYVTCSWFS